MNDTGFNQEEAEHDATEHTSLTWDDVEGDRQNDIRQLFLAISDPQRLSWPDKPSWMDSTQWAIIHACARAQLDKH